MATQLSSYVVRLVENEQKLLASLDTPLVIWAAPEEVPSDELILGTIARGVSHRPLAGQPMVFEVRKDTTKVNPFAMGITVGRNENNDIWLDHPSMSRFHAYFQQDLRTKEWRVVDAESKNGSWAGPLKLAPNKPTPVADGAKLRFGDIELTFYAPASFIAYVREQMGPRK